MPDEVDYFIGFETVTHIGNERLRRVRVSYYQWAPLILLVQGLCFYIPFLIWNSCANNAGVKLRRLLKKASDIASLPPGCQQREALLAEFVDQFHTLVTGEAGWCADLQCGGLGGTGGGGLNSNSNSSASSSASGNSSSVQQQPHQQHSNGPSRGVAQTGLRGGAGAGGASGGSNVQQHNHPRSGTHSGNTNVDSNQDDHDPHNSRHHRSNNNNGCCLISIPIIGSLLACCLKPCSSFGLVGPSKYLCLLYLAVKSAYVFNVGLQFFLLGQFLGRGYLKHGLELINRLIVNGDWWASPRFPLSTLCQVRADMSGGLRSYTCQCVLPINVFNEKIFSVVWFYMAFLMPLNVLSLLFWIYRTFESNRLSYIRLCLWRTRLVELNQIHRTVRRLSQSYLGWDGVFLLRLIEHNHGSIMATLIMSRLWEFYANQMKLQEDANQLALANNAQHTLSNTTTAISNQHQLLAAAAAAAAAAASNQPLGPPLPGHLSVGPGPQGVGGGPGHHNVAGGANHGPSHGQSHGLQQTGHSHGPPLMPTQHQAGGGAHFAASHAHGPNPHGVSGGHFAAAGQVTHGLQQQQQQHMAPLVGHGPHAHHSGQISQPGAHHPLHAANTHHTHAHVAAAAGHHGHPLQAGPFASNMNANILAQLQQQHQHHHHQQPPGSGTTALSAAQSHNVQQSSQTQQQQQQQQGSASGNVAAAVAALAAAAAANSTSGSTPGQQQQQQLQPNSAALSSNSGSAATSGAAIHLHSLLQPTSTGTPTGSGLNNSTNTGTSNSNQSTAASGAVAAASARSQQATSTIQTSTSSTGANNVSASNSSGAQTNNNNNQPASSVASISSSSTSGQQQQQASSLGPQTTSANNGPSAATSATTSFIQVAQPGSGNASSGAGTGAGGAAGSGPPLPPPPPAHIVAAVAAASATNPSIASTLPTNMGVAAPGMARSGPSAVLAANRGSASQVTPQQQQQTSGAQPAPPPHTNPVLFNLKSSSLQAAATNNARQYSPHTIKR